MLEFTKFGQTPIDEDEKLGLIPSLTSLEELNIWEQENIIEGRQWALNSSVLKRNDIFDVAFIIKLHEKMFDKTWAWAGEFRKTNKNIGCEPYEIRIELKKLYDDVAFWIDNKNYSILELALVFHHRLVKIHCFANGNGRHARLVADCIVKKYQPTVKIAWDANNLFEEEQLRKKYILALQAADRTDYSLLFTLFLDKIIK